MRAATIRDKEIVVEDHPDPVAGTARCWCASTPPG